MAPPTNTEDADESDDESFVSAKAVSPVASKGPPPPLAPKPILKPKPELELRPKPATTKSVVENARRNVAGPSTRATAAPAAGPNSKLATGEAKATEAIPSPGLAASPALSPSRTATAPGTQASASRPPAVKPKPAIRLAPVSRSHFANNPLPPGFQTQSQPPSPNRIIASERYVAGPPKDTISKRYTTPPPGSSSTVVSQRLSVGVGNGGGAQPIPINRRPTSSGFGSRPPSQSRIGGSFDASIYTPVPSLGMSVDALANAMVAGALATSAATSRSQSRDILRPSSTGGLKRPPPPPPARRSGTSIFDKLTPGHSRQASRAGSPSKEGNGKRQMKMTLRKEKSGSEDEGDGRHGRHRKRNLVKKHPNKHHEGDRKRWRDVVTEKERKRYEALWASNKGICIGAPTVNMGRLANPNDSIASFNTQQGRPMSVPPAPLPRPQLSRPGSRGDGTQGLIPGFPSSLERAAAFHPSQNPPTLPHPYGHPRNQAGMQQGPYATSTQNLSTHSLATTSGSTSTSINGTSPHRPSQFISLPPRIIAPDKASDCVSSLVVRDIWARSRLPPDVLREIWDLVDRSGTGMLNKEEFCAGMWILDARLKGRKLPQKVSGSVWRSLTGLSGVKVREFKGRDKKP